jgi:hypothetical protein
MTPHRPGWLFDRGGEWSALGDFVEDAGRLAVVWGPRRAGKSTLLAALAEAVGGLYYEAVRQDAPLSLADFGAAVGAWLGARGVRYDSWTEALEAVLSLPGCPVVVLDEFGYLCESSPELPSVLQRALDRSRRTGGRLAGIALCGSAVTQLSHLLDRDQPLFGRAQLALVIDAFDFREAASFWGVGDDPRLALQLHAVLGGLPGYRDVVVQGPASCAAFDGWVVRRVLSSSSPLLEDDTMVLSAAGLEAGVYRSILTAVARGDRTPSSVASRTGRSASSLVRPFDRLVEAGMLLRVADPLQTRRSRYELADPFIAFHDAIVRPQRVRLRRRCGDEVWAESAPVWRAGVLGPHFERVCRSAVERYGAEFGLDGPVRVGPSVVPDARRRQGREVDVVVTSPDGRVRALGEAKHTSGPVGRATLDRLEEIRSVLAHPADRSCRLLLFSARGFSAELRRATAGRRDVELVDLARLYGRA